MARAAKTGVEVLENFLLKLKGQMEGIVEQSTIKSDGVDIDEADSLNH